MRLASFIAGLSIFTKYVRSADSYCIGAEHDEFFIHLDTAPNEPDQKTLLDLGWLRCTDQEEEPADAHLHWSCFT